MTTPNCDFKFGRIAQNERGISRILPFQEAINVSHVGESVTVSIIRTGCESLLFQMSRDDAAHLAGLLTQCHKQEA